MNNGGARIGAAGGGWRGWAGYAGLAALLLLALPFVVHSVRLGVGGLTGNLPGETYLWAPEAAFSNAAIFAHMLAGAVITVLAPLQLVPAIRARVPGLHRASGYVVAGLAVATALAGLVYIPLRGTVGGALMDVGFAGYGLCLLGAAVQTVRLARAGDFGRHREWALRLFLLAIGSWLYRLHYTLWYLATGGLWSEPDFSGAFDRVQVFAFYVPYLVGLEVWFRRRARKGS